MALRVANTDVLTYGDWEARSNAAARGLDVRPGDRVGLVFPNERWADYAVAYLAVLKAGAVAVPIGSRFSGPELERALAHAGATLRLTDVPQGHSTDHFQAPVDPDDLAEILYTSGTTGLPKGVAVTHLGIMAHDVPPDAPAGRVSFLHAFPIGTQAGQETLRVPLRIGGRTAIALPAFNPDLLCSLVARHRVVRLQLVPAMAQVLVTSGAYLAHDVSSVRRIILSSAPAAPALFQRLVEAFPQATVWNAYALTEAGPARTMMQWDPTRPSAVGLPLGETEVHIAADTGEIWLRRRGTPTRSYLDDPEATAQAFAGGWVHTGDIGYLDGDGYLHLTDRLKDLIITGGSNVSSVEVENVLYEHPAVIDAVVVGLPHPVLGEDVAAVVVVRSPTPAQELQDMVRARLAEHKVPHRIVFVDRLPRNASGKVVKDEVRHLFPVPAETSTGATTETEAVVVSVWEAVLGRAGIGVDDDFFALGGHSLAAAQIASRLGDAFAVDMPVAAVFECPTPAELARRLELGQPA